MGSKLIRETTLTEGHAASVPAPIRRRHDIRPGDKLVWTSDGERIEVEIKRKRPGAFEDFDGYDIGEPTNATEEHDEVY